MIVENALTAHPQVREAAAVAVPDSKYGEVVGAWIVRQPNTNMSREDVYRSVADNINPQVCKIEASCLRNWISNLLSDLECTHMDLVCRRGWR